MAASFQSRQFHEWILELDDKVIQDEFGYERGEFLVYPERWYPLFREGLTPRQAWQRALDAIAEVYQKREQEKIGNWDRIQAEDAGAR